jgi:digeranylgeranylglycerophospholipid reductase
MSALECDVLVVGGGPAGCSAARAAAKSGLKTILIEEDTEIGNPVQCAEGIGAYLIPYIPFDVPKRLFKWKISGMCFWAEDLLIKRMGGMWSGYSIDRREWDQWLALAAVKEGVKIYLDTKLISLECEVKYDVKKAVAIQHGKTIEFKPKYIVGADGTNSTVINCLGIKQKAWVGHVKSYEMSNLTLKYAKYDQLFIGEFAPRSYAYIFPLSKTTANIGVGTIFKKERLDDLFEAFIDISFIKKQLGNRKIITEKGGDAPIQNLTEKLVYGNVFLVGDTANQNIKPFIEGNIPGIICGNILGKLLSGISLEKENPNNYEKRVNEIFPFIKESQPYADFAYGKTTIDNHTYNLILLGLMSGLIHPEKKEIGQYAKKGYAYLKKYIIKNGGVIEN